MKPYTLQIFDWVPEFYNDPMNLPDEMPRDLKSHIANLKSHSSKQLDTVWVSCEGENPADEENIGPIRYIPNQGFPGYYFPYINAVGYLSPLVVVHFERPQSECNRKRSMTYRLRYEPTH